MEGRFGREWDEMTVAMNDFKRLWADAGDDVLAAVGKVGKSGWYVLGDEVAGFEQALAETVGCRFAVGCASGLDAVEISLRALGLVPGDKVLTTPLSAFATTLSIVRAGGVPVFVDVDESGLLDLTLAEEALEGDSSIRYLVPVHLFGHSVDLQRLGGMKKRRDLRVVEDCAQSITARHGGLSTGTVGQISAFSFYPTKNLGALGDGGAVVTSDKSLAESCRALRDYGQTEKYVHSLQGLNSRLDELHAAVLLHAFLPRLDSWSARRRSVAQAYLEGIESQALRPFPVPEGSEPAWHLFPVLVRKGRSRDTLITHLRNRGVAAAVHYPRLICDQQALKGVPFEVVGDLSQARALAEGEVSLPIHPYLDDLEVARVIEAVNGWS